MNESLGFCIFTVLSTHLMAPGYADFSNCLIVELPEEQQKRSDETNKRTTKNLCQHLPMENNNCSFIMKQKMVSKTISMTYFENR